MVDPIASTGLKVGIKDKAAVLKSKMKGKFKLGLSNSLCSACIVG